MAQATKKKAPLVPKLRFREFVGDGEWEESNISSIATFHKGKGISKADIAYDGKQPCIRYGEIYTIYDEVIFSAMSKTNLSASKLFLSKINDVIIPASGETKIDIATAACVMKDNIALGGDLNVVRTSQNGIFLSYYINGRLKKELAQKAQGDTVVHLYASQIAMLTISITSSYEQQRIADCLTSLDENITAESHKLEALTAHKKALMQKLFPAEGEKVPALRFKEFAGDGEWEEKRLGELCKFVRGPFGGALKKEIFVKSGYAVYEQSHAIYNQFESFRYFITHEKYAELKRFAVKTNDIIMSCSGTMAKFAIIPENSSIGVINQALLKLTVNSSINIQFIKIFLESSIIQNKLLSQSAGGAIQNVVSVEQLKNILFNIPSSSEQQCIADCLVSLDEYITAQGRKIALLKEHKKGLMQQLFPCMEEENV